MWNVEYRNDCLDMKSNVCGYDTSADQVSENVVISTQMLIMRSSNVLGCRTNEDSLLGAEVGFTLVKGPPNAWGLD